MFLQQLSLAVFNVLADLGKLAQDGFAAAHRDDLVLRAKLGDELLEIMQQILALGVVWQLRVVGRVDFIQMAKRNRWNKIRIPSFGCASPLKDFMILVQFNCARVIFDDDGEVLRSVIVHEAIADRVCSWLHDASDL